MKKLVLLTGPNGHLGSAMLQSLINDFAVLGVSRRASTMSERLKNKACNEYIALDADFESESAETVAKKAVDICLARSYEITGVINNAIFAYPAHQMAIDRATVANCAEGLFGYWVRLSLLLSEHMGAPASIVNISSMYGHVSPQRSLYSDELSINPLMYGCMKAALGQASRYLSSQLGPRGIRVNSISFGPFPSQEVQASDPEFICRLADHTHLGRIGDSREAGGIVRFLMSNESSYISGADIAVDGGWTAW